MSGRPMRKSKQLLVSVLATCLGCASAGIEQDKERPRLNWTNADAPCAKYDDLRNRVLGDIGVKLDAAEPWADAFQSALRFWNTVLAVNLFEDADLNTCAVRIVEGGPDILDHAIAARSHIPDW